MKKFLFLILLLNVFVASAGLPPTTSQDSTDANPVTTFNFGFPNFTGTHNGITFNLGVNSVLGGGTGISTLTANSVMLGEGSTIGFASPVSAGYALIDNGPGNNPSFQSLGLSGYLPLVGGTLTGPLTITYASNVSSNGSFQEEVNGTFSGSGGIPTGVNIQPTFNPSASIANAYSESITPQTGSAGGGAITNLYGLDIFAPSLGSMVPTNEYGLYVNNQGVNGETNSYGLYVASQTGAANSYSAIFQGGNVGIGTLTPANPLSILMTNSSNSANSREVQIAGTLNGSGNSAGGLAVTTTLSPSTSVVVNYGYYLNPNFAPPSGSAVANAQSEYLLPQTGSLGGQITNLYGLNIANASFGTTLPATNYGEFIANQGNAGISTSYGLYVTSPSGSTNNYAAIFTGPTGIGSGATTPVQDLLIAGSMSGTPSVIGLETSFNGANLTDNNTATNGIAASFASSSFGQGTLLAANPGVTTTNAYQVYIGGAPKAGTNENFTNSSALYIAAGALSAGVTNGYALNVSAPTGATNNYAATFQTGNVGIGDANPSQKLDLNGAMVERGIAAPSASSATQGIQYFDSTANVFKISQNGSAYYPILSGNPTSHNVLVGEGTTVGVIAPQTAGYILTSNGPASDPTFQANGSAITNNFWCGYFANGVNWSTTASAYSNFTTETGVITLLPRKSNGITGVTAAASSLPGITFSVPATTASYDVSFTTSFGQTVLGGTASFQLIDSSSNIITQRDSNLVTGEYAPLYLSGVYAPATTGSVTILLQGASGGTLNVTAPGSLASTIDMCIRQIR